MALAETMSSEMKAPQHKEKEKLNVIKMSNIWALKDITTKAKGNSQNRKKYLQIVFLMRA